jgi:hypothetical protein
MVREYRHIKSVKRAGRGHDRAGITGTQNGDLMILCRCCPIPQVNLPVGWEDADPEVA